MKVPCHPAPGAFVCELPPPRGAPPGPHAAPPGCRSDRQARRPVSPPAVTGAAPRGFRSGQRGATTIGAAIAISILITALASLMGIVHKVYTEDRMERGARAAARAVSLAASAPASEQALKDLACRAVERELGEDEGTACACWTIEVEAFETPQALSGGEARDAGTPPGGENADLVLVQVRRPYRDWLSTPARADADADADSCPDASGATEIVAVALARNEREVRVPQ